LIGDEARAGAGMRPKGTDGALGGAGILLMAGLSLLAASMLGLRLHRGSVLGPSTRDNR
jgi:hypothetical protein